MGKDNKIALTYSITTLLITFIVGQILLSLYPDGNTIGSSILFSLMNLVPMIIAIIFAKYEKKKQIIKNMFLQKEEITPYILAVCSVIIYYGLSALLGNVKFANETILSLLSYIPWAILQGGLEECGWRWYLQPKFDIKKYFLKMIIISFVWFLWHIPIYRLSWITAGSSNYLIFYLMILGNTFMFGAIKEYSRGVLLCVIAHIFIDSFAVLMLVQSNIIPIVILVIIEIVIFVFVIRKIPYIN